MIEYKTMARCVEYGEIHPNNLEWVAVTAARDIQTINEVLDDRDKPKLYGQTLMKCPKFTARVQNMGYIVPVCNHCVHTVQGS